MPLTISITFLLWHFHLLLLCLINFKHSCLPILLYVSSNTKSKYVSKIITLADGQDAEDIQIILTAFKPVGSNIQVWIKFLSSEDPEDISQKTWTPMVNDSYNVYSDPSNPYDFKELSFSTGAYYKLTSTTGTITASNSSTTVAGTSTLFQKELEPGWYINMKANSTFNEVTRKVVSIASNTSLTLDSPFNGNYSNVAYYIVPPPTTAWISTNTAVQLTGTVTTYTTNNTITGSSTNFTGELTPGSIISVAGDNQKVVSITNSTSLSVGKPWSAAVAGANAYNISPAGVSYLNNNISLFTTFVVVQLYRLPATLSIVFSKIFRQLRKPFVNEMSVVWADRKKSGMKKSSFTTCLG